MILANTPSVELLLVIGCVVAYLLPAVASARLSVQNSQRALGVAWLLHGVLLLGALVGALPRFGFAPALSVTAWLVLTVYAIEHQLFPQLRARWALAGLGACAVLLALVFPGTPLNKGSSPWLALHWALGIASYGLFAAAVVHAWLMSRAEKQIRMAADGQSGLPLLTLERITFRFVSLGFALLSATLLVGFVFGEALYGSIEMQKSIRWDHKTVFSVMSWLAFAALLAGRHFFGWRGKKASRVLYAGSILLLLAYVGSRFVLEVLLGRAA